MRPEFFEFFNMPSAVLIHHDVIPSANGIPVETSLLHQINNDLFEFGWHSLLEHEKLNYWLRQYETGGAMPGTMTFRSVYTGEWVGFLFLIDDLYNMYNLAANWYDITEDEESDHPSDEEDDWVVVLTPNFPANLGRFNMDPGAWYARQLNFNDGEGVNENEDPNPNPANEI